ncbi:MAG: hypothetical protein ACYDHO_06300 [Gaiellaceae bacterium]
MNDQTLNGYGADEGLLHFESLDTGDRVLAIARAAEGGRVSLTFEHERDGELEILIDPRVAEELALALARAADDAHQGAEEDES